MGEKSLAGVVRHFRQLAAVQTCQYLSDGDLLERFIEAKDQAAFTTLVERHCSLVLGVCRRRLGNVHDAEDACQATFLVLARKAASVRKATSLACWLHCVARSVAANLKRERSRRERRERNTFPPAARDFAADVSWREVQAALDEEIARLPERYRAPLILCYLEGQTRDEAARRLALSPGCLHGRLERGRRMLCDRLTQRGLTLSGVLLAASVGQGTARAALSSTVVLSSSRAALALAGGETPAVDVVSARVLALVRQVSRGLVMSKLGYSAAMALCAGLLLTAGGALTLAGSALEAQSPPKQTASENGDRAKDSAPARPDSLEGEWQAIEVEAGGKKVPSDQAQDLRMTFKGDELSLKSARGDGGVRMKKFKLDLNPSPRAIDITSLDGQEKGQTAKGIYSLKNGRLTICLCDRNPGDRPEEFKTLPGDRRFLVVLERVGAKVPGGAAAPAMRPDKAAADEFAAILREWQTAESEFWKDYEKAKTIAERQKPKNERAAKAETLAQRCVRLAEANPVRPKALAALCWAFINAPNTDTGKKALTLLLGGRIALADPGELADALDSARNTGSYGQLLAPAVLEAAKRNLDHSRAARLLTWVCSTYYRNRSALVPPPFAEAAVLIGDRFTDSPDISNFCECLAPSGDGPPPWAGKYEQHLKTILTRNRDRLVRASASFALASIVRSAGAARRDEAVTLFQKFLKDFDGSDPRVANVEDNYRYSAKVQIEEILQRAPGMPVPEIDGKDLEGKPMKLSQFRGKVVLLSFWATTCAPCMRLIPTERALADRLRDKPFALVGVNCDADDAAIKNALKADKITWQSFQAKSVGNKWSIEGIPTLYLIDDAGIIRKHWLDAPPSDELNRAIDQLVEAVARKK